MSATNLSNTIEYSLNFGLNGDTMKDIFDDILDEFIDEFEDNPTWDDEDDGEEYLYTPCDNCARPDSACDSCPYNNGYDY